MGRKKLFNVKMKLFFALLVLTIIGHVALAAPVLEDSENGDLTMEEERESREILAAPLADDSEDEDMTTEEERELREILQGVLSEEGEAAEELAKRARRLRRPKPTEKG